jgi:hypothetical protein
VVSEGLDFERLPKKQQEELYAKALAQLESYQAEVTELLTQHKETLARIADTLHKCKTLTEAELKQLMGTKNAIRASQSSQGVEHTDRP